MIETHLHRWEVEKFSNLNLNFSKDQGDQKSHHTRHMLTVSFIYTLELCIYWSMADS
jgi:hypothetical protein